MPDIYTKKTLRKIREKAEVKRDFLRELFFKKSSKVPTEEIVLEIAKGGEYVAPMVTPLESGRLMPSKTIKTNIIKAPNIAPKYTLTPKDMFERIEGAPIVGGESPDITAAKKLGKILSDQENYIKNREELMVSQFLTTGKVTAIDGDGSTGYEVNYGLENIETLSSEKQWDKEGVDPLASIDELIMAAEENGVKVENIVLGKEAARIFMDKLHDSKKLSKDLQSEVVKKVIRTYPGVTWLGTYVTYNVEIYRYTKTLKKTDGKAIELIPKNVCLGGPSGGEIIYAPIVNFTSKGPELHVTERFTNILPTQNQKSQEIVTETRPVLQPVELTGYFCAIVCSDD